MENGMKMFEKILERRFRKLITVNNMQFGFSPGKGTTDAVFIILQLQEKHLEIHRTCSFPSLIWKKRMTGCPGIWCIGVSEKERGPREASEASRSNIPWSINSSENHIMAELLSFPSKLAYTTDQG